MTARELLLEQRNQIKGRTYLLGKTLTDIVKEIRGMGYPKLTLMEFGRYVQGYQSARSDEIIKLTFEILDKWEKEKTPTKT